MEKSIKLYLATIREMLAMNDCLCCSSPVVLYSSIGLALLSFSCDSLDFKRCNHLIWCLNVSHAAEAPLLELVLLILHNLFMMMTNTKMCSYQVSFNKLTLKGWKLHPCLWYVEALFPYNPEAKIIKSVFLMLQQCCWKWEIN